MNTVHLRSHAILAVICLLFAALVVAPTLVLAQDDTPIVCDSTLVTLVLVAEHDYDYLSGMMDSETEMPSIDYGQYGPMIESIMAMMMQMMDNMTEEEMTMHEEHSAMVAEMMGMSTQEMMDMAMAGMGMESVDMSTMTQLAPGNVEGEDPACAALRADVESFLVAHIATEMATMDEMADM